MQDGVDGGLGVGDVVVAELGRAGHEHLPALGVEDVVGARAEDHQGRGGTDQQRVHVDGEGLRKALAGRVRDVGGGRCDGPAALAGFVGVDAALDAHHDGGAEDAARQGLDPEGVGHDAAQHGRHLVDVQGDDHQREDDVGEGHERGDERCHAGDAVHAADDHEGEQEGHPQACDQGRDAEGVAQCGRDAVGLDGG